MSCSICDSCEANCNKCQNCQNCQGVACQTCQSCNVHCNSTCDAVCQSCLTCQSCISTCQNCQGVACQTCQVCNSCQACNSSTCNSCQNCEGRACQTVQTCTGCDSCQACNSGTCNTCQNCQGVACQTAQTCTGCNTCQSCNSGSCQSGNTIALSGIDIVESSVNLVLTQSPSTQLHVNYIPSNTTYTGVSWTSSNTSIATVSSSGVVTAVSAGSCYIYAISSYNSVYTDSCYITVTSPSVSVTGVTISPTSQIIFGIGSQLQVATTVLPSNATNKAVTYSSSATSIATVDSTGTITAKGVGFATITVTTVDGGFTAICIVSVVVLVTGVTVSPTSGIIYNIGDTLQVATTVSPSNATNKAVTYSSSDTTIATVDSTGTITAKGWGSATITATTTDGGYTATCAIQVKSRVTGVTISPTSQIIYGIGSQLQVATTVLPSYAYNKAVTYSSSNTNIATVDSTGTITAKGGGLATITVTTVDGGFTASCIVSVVILVTGVTVSPTSGVIYNIGDTLQIAPTVSPSNATNKAVTYSSSNTSIATVDSTGTITAKGWGSATITVTTADGGKTATCTISVQSRVTGVTVSPTSGIIYGIGSQLQVATTVLPSYAYNKAVTYTSSATSVATVDSTGTITAKGVGFATITVTTVDGGFTASCIVSVVILVTGVTVSPTSGVIYNIGDTLQVATTVSPSNATNKAVTYSSSNTSIATVDSTGTITGKGWGSATITVTTADGGKTATCAVIVGKQVTGIDIRESTAPVYIGSTSQLHINFTPSDTPFTKINWSSSDTTIATVDSNGVVTPVKNGSCTVKAISYYNSSLSDTCTVNVLTPCTGVTLNTNSIVLPNVGSTNQLTATVYPPTCSNKNISYSSSNTAIATVDATGLVTGKAIGYAAVTVTTVDGAFTATCQVKVGEPVTGVRFDAFNYENTLCQGATMTITGSVIPSNATNKGVSYSSDNENIVSSQGNGVFKGVSLGNTLVRIHSSEGNFIDSASITVIPYQHPTGISLDQTSVAVQSGQRFTLNATVTPDEAVVQDVTWSSSNSNIVQSLGNGVFLGELPGATTVKAHTVDGDLQASCDVTVYTPKAVTGLLLDNTTMSIPVGGVFTLEAEVLPDDAYDKTVTWTSENEKIVSNYGDGTFVGLAVGTTTVTAHSSDCIHIATCNVTVTQAVHVTGITLDKSNISVSLTGAVVLNATITPSNASNKSINWTSDNEAIVQSATNGMFIGNALGTTMVRATTVDGNYVATCYITVTPYVDVYGISLDTPNTDVYITPNEALVLHAIITPDNATNKAIIWSSEDNGIAQNMGDGVFLGKGYGNTIVGATTVDGGYEDVRNVIVADKVPVTGITLDKTTALIPLNGTLTLNATINPYNATDKNITWSSSNESIVKLVDYGKFVGLAMGTAFVSATTEDGSFSATCQVTVGTVKVAGITIIEDPNQ